MTENIDGSGESQSEPPSAVPDDLAARLVELDPDELRSVISYAESLLPPMPTPASLVEERRGEQILEVNEQDGYTEVIKKQPCAEGCDDCPHGPYLYRVRARPPVDSDSEPTLRWDFLGLVTE